MIVDRKTFIAIMVHEGGLEQDLLFLPENDVILNPDGKNPANWFINCPIIQQLYWRYTTNIDDRSEKKTEYWSWCKEHLSGALYCYWESDTDQWWGFENKDDILLWSLKWL